MQVPLPMFRYHPDPLATGEVIVSQNKCKACGQARGYVYKRNPYGQHSDLAESICPWCIADGSAHAKLSVQFSDDYGLTKAGLPLTIVEEVVFRTPGYTTWQGEVWLTHCNDACAFLGDASKDDLLSSQSDLAKVMDDSSLSDDDARRITDNYVPGGSPSFYKFRCLHCGQSLYGSDFD